MRALKLLRFVPLLMVCALVTSRARAEDIQAAPLTLFVNEEQQAPSTVLLRGEDALVLRKDLEDAGVRRLPATGDETIDGKVYVSLARLRPDVQYNVDERTLALRIVAAPQFFDATVVNLRSNPPSNLVQHKDAGFFFNYAPRLVDLRTFAASGEAGASVGGQLLYSGASYDTVNGPVRGLTNLTIDEPGEMRRWVIGDSFVTGGGPLAGSVFLGGLNVARAFQLNPYFVGFPAPTTNGMALTASTVDVYVNGLLVRRVPIAPGPFQLQNIPATPGAGTTRYVLRDAFGREQQVVSSFYTSSQVFSRGVSDYGLALGALRNEFGASSWNYGALAVLGHYRVGITDHLTVGVRGEAPLDARQVAASAGPSLTLLTPVGQIDVGLAASTAPDGADGVAGSASYLFQSPYFAGGVSARSMSDHYFTLNLGPLDDRTQFAGTAFVSIPIGRRATLSSSYLLEQSRNHGTLVTMSLQSSVTLAQNVLFNTTVSRSRYPDGTAPLEAFATLTIVLGAATSASASAHVRGSKPDGTLDVTKSIAASTDYGYRAGVTEGAHTLGTAAVNGQFQYGQGQIDVTSFDREVHWELGVAGGIVVVPGAGVFFTRPVQDGYAVIQVPGAKNVRGYLNSNEVGRTNGSGNLLVPNLLPYYENRLSISDQDLPADYRAEGTDMVVAPPNRGAAVVRFDAKPTSFVRGTFVVRRGEEDVVPSYGEVTVHQGKAVLTSPLAREGEFEFEGLTAGDYAARIEYAEGTCDLTFVVQEKKGAVAELGTIVCVAP